MIFIKDNCRKRIFSHNSQISKEQVFSAAQKGNLSKIEEFLEKQGGSIQELDFRRSTLLHVACAYQRFDIVKYLIYKGADINAKNYCQLTPLHHACANGHVYLVEFLISKGASVNVSKDDFRTPLHLAAFWGHLAVVRTLLRTGADPHARARDGTFPGEDFEDGLAWELRASIMAVLENARDAGKSSLANKNNTSIREDDKRRILEVASTSISHRLVHSLDMMIPVKKQIAQVS